MLRKVSQKNLGHTGYCRRRGR